MNTEFHSSMLQYAAWQLQSAVQMQQLREMQDLNTRRAWSLHSAQRLNAMVCDQHLINSQACEQKISSPRGVDGSSSDPCKVAASSDACSSDGSTTAPSSPVCSERNLPTAPPGLELPAKTVLPPGFSLPPGLELPSSDEIQGLGLSHRSLHQEIRRCGGGQCSEAQRRFEQVALSPSEHGFRAEWHIVQLRLRLRQSWGKPLVSPCFAIGELKDARLMLHPKSPGANAAEPPEGKHERGKYKKMVNEGPLGAELRLKLPSAEALSIKFYLTVGDAREGPFECNFAEQGVHSCGDFDMDWFSQVESGDTLCIGLEVVEESR